MEPCILKSDEQTQSWYKEQIALLDPRILGLGLGQPALRALVNLKVNSMEDLKRVEKQRLQNSHGIGPKAYRKLETLS